MPESLAVVNDALEREAKALRAVRQGVAIVVQLTILVALIYLLFYRAPQVTGRSMEPQLIGGEHVLINTLAYDFRVGGSRPLVSVRLHPIARGDVVAFFHGEGDGRRLYLKRVVALPGEAVAIAGGVVTVNGRPLAEDYATTNDGAVLAVHQVGAGSIFLLGDNRTDSDDSRAFGPVEESSVIGRAVLVIWPVQHVGRVH